MKKAQENNLLEPLQSAAQVFNKKIKTQIYIFPKSHKMNKEIWLLSYPVRIGFKFEIEKLKTFFAQCNRFNSRVFFPKCYVNQRLFVSEKQLFARTKAQTEDDKSQFVSTEDVNIKF